jgi:hypothetical protein
MQMSHDQSAKGSLRFTLRTALTWFAFLALVIAWYTSMQRERVKHATLLRQLMNARMQVGLAESRAEIQSDLTTPQNPAVKEELSRAGMQGLNLHGAVIQAGTSAFQKAVFDNCDLTNASLNGGGASFQGASFNKAVLRNAKLTGGGSSFQLATFESADLSGAALTGNLQGVSLKNARCVGTTIQGSFQGANIDATQFQDADLTAIESANLESCYFDAPPTYKANTRFPVGFDPIVSGWTKAQ